MEKLFQSHKNVVVAAITTLSILFALNVICDHSFRVIGISNPLWLILLIGTVIPYLISMVSGFDTEKLIGASAVAIGIMLLANVLGGHESLVAAEVIAGGIGVFILFFTALSLSGTASGNDKGKETKDKAKETEKDTKSTKDEKYSFPSFLAVVIIVLLVVFALSQNKSTTTTDNTIPANISNQTSNNGSNSSQSTLPSVVTNINPKAAAGTGVKN